jgi:hypothetical protein
MDRGHVVLMQRAFGPAETVGYDWHGENIGRDEAIDIGI